MCINLRRYGWACIAIALVAVRADGETSEWNMASDAYGRGVHAYFSGRYGDAEAWLNRAVSFNPNDPRIYYFRALSLMRLGRGDEACSDMQLGASLEAEAPNRYSIGAALQRVQGSDRLTLERYRRQSLAGARAQRQQVQTQRSTRVADDAEVLYQPVVVPLDEFFSPGEPRALTADELKLRAAAADARAAAAAAGRSGVAPPNPFQDDAAGRTGSPAGPAETTFDDAETPARVVPEPRPVPPQSPPPAVEPESEVDPFSDL